MDNTRCDTPTRAGGRCRWPRDECPHHQANARRQAPSPPLEPGVPPPSETVERPPERDLRELGWWLVDEVLANRVGREQATGVAAIMRVLAGLGPDEDTTDDALAEVELRGRLAHGMPPRDDDEWELARQRFTGDALREFARWSVEGDGGDGGEPLRGLDRAADEPEMVPFSGGEQ